MVFYWFTVKWLRYTSISIIGFLYAFWLSGVVTSDEVTTQVVSNSQTTKKQVPVLVSDTAKQKTPDQQLQDLPKKFITKSFPDVFNGQPFDVVVLNICSLATVDLNAIGVEPRNLFADFDILFSQFNSATSYSGPAAIFLSKLGQKQVKSNYLNR